MALLLLPNAIKWHRPWPKRPRPTPLQPYPCLASLPWFLESLGAFPPEPQCSPSSHPTMPTGWSPQSWSARQRAPQPARLRHEVSLSPHCPMGMVPREGLLSYWLGRARHLGDHPVRACSRVPRSVDIPWTRKSLARNGIVPWQQRNHVK
jgi:hypothetical protein